MENSTKVVTGKVRFCYVNVFEPTAMNEDDTPKYNICILIPKTDTKTLKKLTRLLRLLSKQVKLSSQIKTAKYLQTSNCLCAMVMTSAVMTLHSKACISSTLIASVNRALWTRNLILLWKKKNSTVVATAVHQSTSMPSMFRPKASQPG